MFVKEIFLIDQKILENKTLKLFSILIYFVFYSCIFVIYSCDGNAEFTAANILHSSVSQNTSEIEF